jgi:hypothetical protein
LIAKGKHFSLAFAAGKYFVYSQGKFCLLGERPTAWSTAMVDFNELDDFRETGLIHPLKQDGGGTVCSKCCVLLILR